MAMGQMPRYMNSSLDPLTAAAGAVMVAMAALELRGVWSDAVTDSDHDHDHRDQGLEQALTYALVAGMLVLGLVVAPKTLGTAALAGEDLADYLLAFDQSRVGRPTASAGEVSEQPIEDVPALLGYLGRVGEAGLGQPVRVSGLVARSGGTTGDGMALLRYSIVHCVADARPVGFLISGSIPAVELDRWVQVEGGVSVREHEGERLLAIEATSVTPAPEPADPYIHPPF
jgi:uncharacterized repeat protein (TIGR03943 family)